FRDDCPSIGNSAPSEQIPVEVGLFRQSQLNLHASEGFVASTDTENVPQGQLNPKVLRSNTLCAVHSGDLSQIPCQVTGKGVHSDLRLICCRPTFRVIIAIF